MDLNQTTSSIITVSTPSPALIAASTRSASTPPVRGKAGAVKPSAAAAVRSLNDMPELHPLASLFPAMSVRAKAALAADIKQNGQQVPIILWEGKVVDGRHRAQVCLELGIPITAIDYAGELDPLDLVWSLNAVRRDITQSQRGIVAAERVNYPRSGGRLPAKQKVADEGQCEVGNLTDLSSPSRVLTTKQAAQAVGVDPRTVTSGNAVCASKSKRLIEAVKAGHIAIEPAAKIARQLAQLPAEEHDSLIDHALKVEDEDEFAVAEKRLRARVKNAWLQGKSIPDCEFRSTLVEAAATTFVEAQRHVKAAISAIKMLEGGEHPESLSALVVACKAFTRAAG